MTIKSVLVRYVATKGNHDERLLTQQEPRGRPSPPRRRSTAILVWLTCAAGGACLLSGCSKDPEPSAPAQVGDRADQLIVAVHGGPTSWFTGPQGDPAGFDHDLLMRFAAESNFKLRTIEANSATELLAKVAAGAAHVGVGGLYGPAPSDVAKIAADDARVLWTQGHFAVEPVVIYNVDGFKPKHWRDLQGATLAYTEGTGIDAQFAAIRADHPEVTWTPLTLPSVDALIALVADGAANYAVVPSVDAAAARNIHLDFDVAFVAGGKRDLAWAVAPDRAALRDQLESFFARARRDGLLTRLAVRYFGYARQVKRIDAGVFQERLKTLLPQYRPLLQDAQAATGIEWRLLAAVAYQESQWNPVATSETGVRGIMQITEETARHLGVADRLDPKVSILAGARYLQDLKSKLPARISEPDRTWLALAAFNIGTAHLEDARILTQKRKGNPDLWSDVKQALPLLALPEYHELAKYGYARGGMPVVFVDRVRAYYDILLRHEPAFQPRLRAFPAQASR